MATAGTLIVRLMAKTDQFRKEMEESQKQLQKTAETSQGVSAAIAASLVAVGAAAVVAGGGAVKLAARLEQTQVAFTTLLGHAAAANAMIRDLQKFAAETPFEFPGLADAARQLIAFGIEAEKTIPTLRRIGDISAGIGAPIGEIAEIYGKARVQGRMFAEDVNQLAGRGIPIIGELAKQFGVAESEVRRLVESGQVHFKHLERAFVSLTGEGGKFAGLMKAQSETIAGLWSTLKDNVGLAATALGETIIKSLDLKGVIKNLINATDRVRTLFENFRDNVEAIGIGRALEQMFSPQIRLAVIGLAGAISGALVPALIVAATAIKKNVIALSPFIATGIVVAAVAYNLYDAWTRSSSAFDKATATSLALATALIIMNKLGVIALIKSIPGTIVGLGLLTVAKWKAVAAATTLKAKLVAVWALLGPKGWLVLAGAIAATTAALRTMNRITAPVATQTAHYSDYLANVDKSAQDAAKTQEELDNALKDAGKAAGKNIMAFDQVHQLQEDMAGAGRGAAAAMDMKKIMEEMMKATEAMAMPEIKIPEIKLPGIMDAMKTVWEEPIAWLKSKWTEFTAWLAETWGRIRIWATETWTGIKTAIETPIMAVITWLQVQWITFLTWLVETWSRIRAWAGEVWGAIRLAIETPIGIAITWLRGQWSTFSVWLAETWNRIRTVASEVWIGIGTAISAAVGTTIIWLREQWTIISTWLFETWDKIRTLAITIWSGVRTAIETPTRTVIAWLQTQWNTISSTLSRIWEGIRTLARNKWEGVRDIIRGVLNSIISLINRFIRFWNRLEFRVPSVTVPFLGTFGGWTVRVPSLPEIPALAKGGIVTNPTLAMIGEAGPEAVLPLRRGAPGVDAIADAIGKAAYAAVYAAMRDAIRVARVEQGREGQRQEVVLEIDGNKIGRAVLPTLIREGQRLGVPVVRLADV